MTTTTTKTYRDLIDDLGADLALYARSMGYTEGPSQVIYRRKGTDELVWADSCIRCGGTGYFAHYGTCFRCGGVGSRTHEVRRGKVANLLKKDRKAQHIFNEGLRFRDEGLTEDQLRAIAADEAQHALTREAARLEAYRMECDRVQREEEEREYREAQERKARREENRLASLSHLKFYPAEVGERVKDVEVKCLCNVRIGDGFAYGTSRYLIKFETPDGIHRLTWFTTAGFDFEEGQTYTIAFTVKDNETVYKGERATVVNRVKAQA